MKKKQEEKDTEMDPASEKEDMEHAPNIEHKSSLPTEDDMKRIVLNKVLKYFERVGLNSSKYESWVRHLDYELLRHCGNDQLAKMFVRGKMNTVDDNEDLFAWYQSIGFHPDTALWLQSLVNDGDVDTKENMPFRALLWLSSDEIPPNEQKQLDSFQTGKWGEVKTDRGGSFWAVRMEHNAPNFTPLSDVSEHFTQEFLNNHLLLFHGTDAGSARDIVYNGADLVGSRYLDFNIHPSFYAGNHFGVAREWSQKRQESVRPINDMASAVVVFVVPRNFLVGNNILTYNANNRNDWERHVRCCRHPSLEEAIILIGQNTIVRGPICTNPEYVKERDSAPTYKQVNNRIPDQFCFLTRPVIDQLNKYPRFFVLHEEAS